MFAKFLSLLLLVTVTIGAVNAQTVTDWWMLQNYHPTEEIEDLAQKASFSEGGEQLFYISRPEVNNKAQFVHNCPTLERGSVLGCYTGNEIYLLNPNRVELENIIEVTAAHEMLHAAYARLSVKQKQEIDTLLLVQYKKVEDKKVIELVEEYKKADPTVLNNELHSILPTQVEKLPPELEEYFSQYFIDRKVVVRAYKSYAAVFADIEEQLSELEAQINVAKSQITNLKNSIETLEAELSTMQAQMTAYNNSGNTAEYNAMVPLYNQRVERYRQLVTQHNVLVDKINNLVAQYNDLALYEKDLAESLESTKISPF
ncbi:MAG: hypothetical protein WDZ81_01235 [Candidatus Saccharimonadales bacterium]